MVYGTGKEPSHSKKISIEQNLAEATPEHAGNADTNVNTSSQPKWYVGLQQIMGEQTCWRARCPVLEIDKTYSNDSSYLREWLHEDLCV
jgi:hypothetical protein